MSARKPESQGAASGRDEHARSAEADAAADNGPGIVTVATGIPRPETASSAATLRRSAIVISVCAGTALFFGLTEIVLDRGRVAAVSVAAAAAHGGLLLLLRYRPKLASLFAHVCLALAVIHITMCSFYTGGARSPDIYFLAGVPLLAGALLGSLPVIGWTLASLAAISALALTGSAAAGASESQLEWALKATFLVLAAMAMSLALRRLTGWQVQSLEHREETIRSLLRGLAEKNRELSAARDEALQASRAKGEFLAVMSHEIRTPLNAVIALTGVLMDTPLNAEQKDLTGTIRHSGATLLTLLNEILDFSKIEAGRLDLESTPFDVMECAEDALELLGGSAAEKKLDLCCFAAHDLPSKVLGDPGRVRQILVNLVSNAVKFTASGSVQVHLTVERIGPKGEVFVHGAVRDTGIGIPKDRVKALFEPFSQVDASTTSKFGGTGLGLAICRKLAERMGGRAWVESTFGEGSAFHFTFATKVVEPAPFPPSMGQIGIVIIPEEGTRRAVVTQLAIHGVVAHAFADVAEAANATSLPRPDLLVIGHRVDLGSAAGALMGSDAVPVIVVGAHDTSRMTLSGINAAVGRRSAAVASPVRRSQLALAMRRVFDDGPPMTIRTSEAARAKARSLRVLVAEDNPVNQRVMKLLLEREGHRVDVVANGAEAIAAARRGGYEVVLMDVRMPEVDGLTAARTIREEIPKEQQPYIIALTANVTAKDREECSAAGMEGFLAKPFAQKDLQIALAAVKSPPATPS